MKKQDSKSGQQKTLFLHAFIYVIHLEKEHYIMFITIYILIFS